MKRKVLSLVLCTALLVTTVICMPFGSYAAGASAPIAARQVTYSFLKASDTTTYTDDYFRGDSSEYNISLATCSMMLSMASAVSWRKDVVRSASVKAFLEDNGFTDFEASSEFNLPATPETSAVACAHKKITDGGKTYTLLAIVPRSGTSGEEWSRNLTQSSSADDTADYAGFRDAAAKALVFAKEYVKKYGISGDIKVWTSGYSGGACTDNLLAASILRDTSAALGRSVRLDPSDMYCYAISPMRVASRSGDYADSRYDCIHNVNSDADILANFPTDSLFTRYGTEYLFTDFGNKEKMLRDLKLDYPDEYEDYVNSTDPDLFRPRKLDIQSLLNGDLVMAEDDDPYLDPPTQGGFFDALTRHAAEITKDAGPDSRSGYYNKYQEPLVDFLSVLRFDAQDMLMTLATGTKTSIPMILSMYMSFTLDKSLKDSSAQLNEVIEDTFNRVAEMIEEPDGTLKPDYRGLKYYTQARNSIFRKEFDGEDDEIGRYVLRTKINRNNGSLILKAMKEITADLYAMSLRESLKSAEVDEETITKLTSRKDAAGMSWFLTGVLFGDSDQSKGVAPLNIDNEQIRHLATFIGCLSGMADSHMYWVNTAWLRSADPLYDDYQRPTEAQSAGYRRLHISGQSAAVISGKVMDGSGAVTAEFENGVMKRTADDWIGMTVSDSGYWLRLPLDKDYKVELSSGSDTALSLRLAEYSVPEGAEVRSVSGDSKLDWRSIGLKKGDTVTVNVPAAAGSGEGYVLPTGTSYSADVKKAETPKEKYSSKVPKVRKVKVKASRKSFTVRWKKLSSSQKKNVSFIEVQYSTKKSFKGSKTVTKKVKKSKSALKVRKLKKGKYYVRVRNVKKSGGIKLVSRWTKAKTVKVR